MAALDSPSICILLQTHINHVLELLRERVGLTFYVQSRRILGDGLEEDLGWSVQCVRSMSGRDLDGRNSKRPDISCKRRRVG